MTETINFLIDSYNIPVLTAFLLGVLTSISPCPLTTNITAIAYISKEIKTARHTLLSGFFYMLGRGASYTLLATFIYFGFSAFEIASLFRGWGDKALGPILIIIGLTISGAIKINPTSSGKTIERTRDWLSKRGFIGSFLLGMLFALAFCPSSGILFFGVLIPMILKSNEGLFLAPIFALGTGLPVFFFAFLLAFSLQKVGRAFQAVTKIEKVMRHLAAAIFIGAGIYYTQYLIQYLSNF
ncbi:MAG: aromatic aminobenezylarsenical efflux permease ArsG family transporter [Candidatus Pacebacteria bacterium]|nr:aromatic aminobenezylarsenical efflux permease ArsG family transporter [Candidatus Paceibacterota bacterium]